MKDALIKIGGSGADEVAVKAPFEGSNRAVCYFYEQRGDCLAYAVDMSLEDAARLYNAIAVAVGSNSRVSK